MTWLTRLLGVDGLTPVSSTNPIPVTGVLATNSSVSENILEAEGTAVNQVVTLTVPAVSGKTIVLNHVAVDLFSSTARGATGANPPPQASITNLGNTFSKFLPSNATLVGVLETIPLISAAPQKAASVGTAVVITVPAYAACVGRIQAAFTYV